MEGCGNTPAPFQIPRRKSSSAESFDSIENRNFHKSHSSQTCSVHSLNLALTSSVRNKDPAISTNQFECIGVRLGSDQCQVGAPIRGRDLDPALAAFQAVIDDQFETQLVDVESQATVLIANKNDHV